MRSAREHAGEFHVLVLEKQKNRDEKHVHSPFLDVDAELVHGIGFALSDFCYSLQIIGHLAMRTWSQADSKQNNSLYGIRRAYFKELVLSQVQSYLIFLCSTHISN